MCPPACERVYVGKLPDRHALSQEEINSLLVTAARQGHAVVRLKGGDPFVLGRGSEEAQACASAGVPFAVVPGVTAGIAAPAYAGIPVTHRGVAPAFAVVTGHEDPTKGATQVDYGALGRFPGTLLLYMGIGRLREIAAALVDAGRPAAEPVALVEWGTTPRQRTVVGTLADIAARQAADGVTNPAMIVVGDVVALRDEIAWFEHPGRPAVAARRPLHGVSVLVPRTRHQAGELSVRLASLGAEAVEAPTIAIAPTGEAERLRDAVTAVADGAYDWVAFTSANGVEGLFAQVDALGGDARLLARTRLAVVGPATAAALAGRGLRADLVAEPHTTAGLTAALLERAGGPARALLPRADIATPALTAALRTGGWTVDEVEAYRTVPVDRLDPDVRRRLEGGDIDVVAFASSSTVRNLVALLGGPPDPSVRVASIGPVTSQTCAELGVRVDAEAAAGDIDGLVDAVIAAHRAAPAPAP